MSLDIQTTISDVNIFLEKLKSDLPEVFSSKAEDQQQTAPAGKVLYLGDMLPADITVDSAAAQNTAQLQDGRLKIILKSAEESPSQTAELWLRQQAAEVLPARTKDWAQKLGVEYNNIVIKDQRTMWASCSAKKNLNYSYRIIKMPSSIIDYLILHELVHLIHFNHGADYWGTVALYCPEYKEHRKWLNANKYAIMSDVNLTFNP